MALLLQEEVHEHRLHLDSATQVCASTYSSSYLSLPLAGDCRRRGVVVNIIHYCRHSVAFFRQRFFPYFAFVCPFSIICHLSHSAVNDACSLYLVPFWPVDVVGVVISWLRRVACPQKAFTRDVCWLYFLSLPRDRYRISPQSTILTTRRSM